LVVNQRWTDYKRWTDFGGSWLSKAEYKWVILNEKIQNPYYKFFWWWLRYAVLIAGEVVGRIKVFGVAGVERIYRSSISGVRFFVKSVGNIKVQSKSCISQRVSWQHFGTWQDWTIATNGKWYYKCWSSISEVIEQVSAIIGMPFQVLGVIKILGVCNSFIRLFVESVGNIKVQSKSCISQRVSWQHFGTWQDWTIATNGKWYYNKC
jgi:hypothetical protein